MTNSPTEHSEELVASDSVFSVRERTRLKKIAGLIVPASAEYGIPGADDPDIYARCLVDAEQAEELIRSALAYAESSVTDWHDDAVATQTLEGQGPMAPLVSLVLQCYYQDDRVMSALGMEPRAPFPIGYSVPEGDWSMLEPVQKRGKIWRDA